MNIMMLAELSGVSKSTVYRAVNGEKIKESTKKRILAVMKENNMTCEGFPGFGIGGSQNVRLVAFISDKTGKNGIYAADKMIKEKFSASGFTVIDVAASAVLYGSEEEKSKLDNANFHGYIFYGADVVRQCADFIKTVSQKRPVITINAEAEGKNVYSITNDIGEATFFALSKLTCQLSHRRILYCISEQSSCKNMLLCEFEKSVSGCGLKNASYSTVKCRGGELETVLTIADALRRNSDITAVVAQDDFTACCAVKVAEKLGLKIPENLSVIGYQYVEHSEAVAAAISCINTKSETVSDMALMLMVSILNGRNVTHKIKVPCVFTERRTTALAKSHKPSSYQTASASNSVGSGSFISA